MYAETEHMINRKIPNIKPVLYNSTPMNISEAFPNENGVMNFILLRFELIREIRSNE